MIARLSLELSDAEAMIAAARVRAGELGLRVAVAVVDPAGLLIALQTMDGTQGAGPEVAIAKARAAALFKRPTAAFEEVAARLDKPAVLMLTTAVPGALPVTGGVPVLADRGLVREVAAAQVAGAVGVSGGSGDQDADVALAAVRACP